MNCHNCKTIPFIMLSLYALYKTDAFINVSNFITEWARATRRAKKMGSICKRKEEESSQNNMVDKKTDMK